MAEPNFNKESPEEEWPSEREGTGASVQEDQRESSGLRRVLILLVIGVVLVGGWYLAQPLFFKPAPPVTVSSPPAAPAPPIKIAAPAAPAVPSPTTLAKPPATEETKQTATAPPAKATAPIPPAKVETPAKATAAPPASEQKPAPQPKATAKVAEKPTPKTSPASFTLQVGAMVMEGNAVALKRKLDGSGFPATIRKGTGFVAKQIVTVGEPTGKVEAEDLARRLNVDGFPSQLLAVGNKFTPQIGAFFILNEAIDLAREVQKKNYTPKITSKQVTTTVYQVRSGKFSSRAAAVKRGDELRSKGFSVSVVGE